MLKLEVACGGDMDDVRSNCVGFIVRGNMVEV